MKETLIGLNLCLHGFRPEGNFSPVCMGSGSNRYNLSDVKSQKTVSGFQKSTKVAQEWNEENMEKHTGFILRSQILG